MSLSDEQKRYMEGLSCGKKREPEPYTASELDNVTYKAGDEVVLDKMDCNILLDEGYKVGDVVTLTYFDTYEGWHGIFPNGEEWSLVDCVYHKQVPLSDNVNSPSHYNQAGIECIDALAASLGEEGFKAYCKGNVIKYLWRMEYKGKSLEDAKKARWYLNKLIERMEENG